MTTNKPFVHYRQVPPGSTVQVTIDGPAGTFNADGSLIGSNSIQPWSHADLVPGPATGDLVGEKRSYFAHVRLSFLAQATVKVRLEIVTPEGATHSKPTDWEIDANNGAVESRGAFIDTE